MKVLSMMILALTLSVGNVLADEHDHKDEKNHKHNAVEGMVKESKTSRRKKVEMCHDCGKPEVNCDCPEEMKKKEQEAKKKAAQ